MFTSIIECTLKPREKESFDAVLREHILCDLRKASGFVDLLAIATDARERTLAVTVWRTRGDATRCQEAHFADLVSILKPLVVRGSIVKWAPGDSLRRLGRTTS